MHPGHAVSGTAGRTPDRKTSGTAGGTQRAQNPAVRCRAAGLRHLVAMACGRECRGAVQLPHLRADADNSAAGADRAGEYPLWSLRHQPGLSGRNAGHPGLVGCVRHLWDAAAGGQRPRSLPALSARRAAAPHCTGGGYAATRPTRPCRWSPAEHICIWGRTPRYRRKLQCAVHWPCSAPPARPT